MTFLEYRQQFSDLRTKGNYIGPQLQDIADMKRQMNEITGNKDIEIIPYDCPLKGRYGFMVFLPASEGKQEKSVDIYREMHDRPIQVVVTSESELNDIFYDAYTNNYRILLCDDPVKLLVGFLVFKRNCITWYHCHVSLLKHNEG